MRALLRLQCPQLLREYAGRRIVSLVRGCLDLGFKLFLATPESLHLECFQLPLENGGGAEVHVLCGRHHAGFKRVAATLELVRLRKLPSLASLRAWRASGSSP